jgi:hypothetical protein
MAATRFQHEGGAFALPDASLAVFFMGGAYLASAWLFLGLLLLAGGIDYVAIQVLGISDFCISPAYFFLIPAYGVLWLGGQQLSRRWHGFDAASGLNLALLLPASMLLSFLISDGSFQYFSGKTAVIPFAQFLQQSAEYFPAYTIATAIYVLAAGFIHALLRQLSAASKADSPFSP